MSRETCNVGPKPIVINGVVSPIYMEENKWVTGVITLLIGAITLSITGRAPPCACTVHFWVPTKRTFIDPLYPKIVHRNTDVFEITPITHLFIRPFIGVSYNSMYNYYRGPPDVVF